ncbi:MAG: T9SS type A sorting domain-containing protein [Bacteroidetes bacterium]|nr:T9SS type A sorting domain-containing protein [Bacteroidota bacterium]
MRKGLLLSGILLIFCFNHLISNPVNDNNPASAPLSDEAYLHMLRSNQHTGKLDPAHVLEARNQVNRMVSNKNQTNLNWTPLGPDNYGGKTKAIIYDSRDPQKITLLAGSTGGGIWRTVNEGVTWQPVSSLNLTVSCMVQAPNGDIYVGTGDGFGAHLLTGLNDMAYTTGFMGNGIWKSTDGTNFTQLPATVPQPNDNNAAWAFINELAINSSGHIFAATNAGLRYSTDGGNSWQIAKDNNGNDLSLNATDVQVGSDGTLMAAVDNKVYISKNGDPQAFVLRSTAESNTLPTADVSRVELAVAPSDPNIMYAVLINSFGIHLGIYRSGDKGDTWSVILPATTSVNPYNQRGLYNNHITVFPNDPNRIILGGVNLWQGRRVLEAGLYAWDVVSSSAGSLFSPLYVHFGQQRVVFKPGSNTTFFVATDGGIFKGEVNGDLFNYSNGNRNYMTAQFYTVAPSGIENRVLGGAQDQGTIFISGEGNTFRQGEKLYTPTTSGGSCVVSTINPNAIVVSATAGSMQRSEDMAFTFSTQFLLASGFGNPQAFRTPIALWESFTNENSRDSITFKAKRNYSPGAQVKARSTNFDQPFLTNLPAGVGLNQGDTIRLKDPVSTRLFIAVANRLWMTKEFLNFAKTPEWFEISNSTVGFTGIPQSIAYSADGNHVWVGMRDGKLFRISNIALAYNATLASVTSPQCIVATRQMQLLVPGTSTPVSQAITSISVDPKNPNNVMVTLANYGNDHYVFATTNGLDGNPLFVSKQGNLPKMPVYSGVIEMTNNGLAIVGTEMGIFHTNNLFDTNPVWLADQNLANIPVMDLKQQIINKTPDTLQLINVDTLVVNFPGATNYGILYAATFGRGLMRCNDFRMPVGIGEQQIAGSSKNFPVLVYPTPASGFARAEFELPAEAELRYSIFNQSGQLIETRQLGRMTPGKQQIRIDLNGYRSGSYLLMLDAGQQKSTVKFLVY